MKKKPENFKDGLKKIIAEEVVNLIDTIFDPTPVDPYAGYDVQEGYVRERYGYLSGICDAAELAGLTFKELQAIKDAAAQSKGKNWCDVLDKIKY